MMDRKEMILALTKFELEYLMDNPELLIGTARFFAEGGFNTRTDEQLRETLKDNVWVDI